MFLRRKNRLGADQPSHEGVHQSLSLGFSAPQVQNQVYENPFPETAASNCRATKLFDLYKKNVESGSLFSDEFKKVENQSKNNQRTRDVSQLPQNAVRNRYKNIFPYDHARVVLQGSGENDYINAAYIPGYDNERKFIATQGPKKETINDFWLMVWQENSNIIVMLTGLRENGKSKCEQYWPDVESQRELSPVLTVRTQREITIGGILQRQLVLFTNREQRTITQLQFTTWPDHGIPVTTSNMIHLRNMVDDLQNTNAPIIVHCSAGVGRTGTYIAMDTLFHELDDKGTVDVPRTVLRMRENRKDMIQNVKQYMYVYKLLMERESLEETDKDVTELQSMTSSEIKKMQDKEFNTLSSWRFGEEWQENHPQLRTYKNTSVKVNNNKNKSIQQLDASYIQEHGSSDCLVAARNPGPGEKENFWKMIVDRGASLVVDLDNSIQILINTAIQYEDISVSVRDVNESNVHSLITVNVWSTTNAFAAQQVMLMQVKGWNDVEQPPKEMDLIKIIEEMQRQKSKQNCKCVLVGCSNGSTRTGTFIALVSILERLKALKRVDVFRTVKDLRDMRPNMVDNKELYRYCYSVVMQYLSDFDTYSNFK
uniref:Tyrosine-protein phosphatase non-receptor type 20 n=1 Tax=Phallusia mammillata TaxID=59560 RepID=A0A6F9DQ89_9ASCI|nr:receptor-type tyrosine-protein phosphatase epsilon-like [Phallusia mammillata]